MSLYNFAHLSSRTLFLQRSMRLLRQIVLQLLQRTNVRFKRQQNGLELRWLVAICCVLVVQFFPLFMSLIEFLMTNDIRKKQNTLPNSKLTCENGPVDDLMELFCASICFVFCGISIELYIQKTICHNQIWCVHDKLFSRKYRKS